MARPRLPTELKKLKGTINTTREKREPGIDTVIKNTPMIINATSVSCPKTITDKYCRSYWKKLTNGLLSLGVLSAADIPQIEQLCICLQKLREVQELFASISVTDDNFDLIEKRWLSLSNKFDTLGAKYYVSPVARAKIKLDDLNIRKTEQEIAKNDNAIDALLSNRTISM